MPAGAKLAVVTVAHNSSHALPGWVEALEALPEREALELCVVDSGSSPQELERERRLVGDRVEHFVAAPNLGFGGASNLGAAATEAPAILFTNPDTLIRSLPARALAETGPAGTILGAFEDETEMPLAFRRFPHFLEEVEEMTLARWSRAFERDAVAPAWVSGAALLIGRPDFERIYGFSPAYFMYCEDADICARHRYAGGAVELDPTFRVEHASGESSSEERRSAIGPALNSVSHQSARRFVTRYGRPGSAALLYLLLVLFYAPRRLVVLCGREGQPLSYGIDYVRCLLSPRRSLRRLGAVFPPPEG